MFNFCWHRWKYVYRVTTNMFLGENCPRLEKEFRVCTKCSKAQELCATPGLGGCWWRTLPDCETGVLLKKVVDKGDYFVLEVSRPPTSGSSL